MYLVFHRKVYSDIDEIMEYYERVATRELADEFYCGRYYMQQAAERPESPNSWRQAPITLPK